MAWCHRIAALAVLLAITDAGADPLDAADEAFRAAGYRQAWSGALGQEQRWTNPATGHAGSVKAVKERLDPATRLPCREIMETLMAGDGTATGYAVGCRGNDGAWRIVQTSAAAGSGAGDLSGLPAQVRILVPWRGSPGAPPPAPH